MENNQSKDPIFRLCDEVREAAYALYSYLRHGHAEKVYENGLRHRLEQLGLVVVQQPSANVHDEDGTVIGHFVPDLLVADSLLVEVKALPAIGDDHVGQVLGYLRATNLEHGLLINFGAPKLQVKKLVLSHPAPAPARP